MNMFFLSRLDQLLAIRRHMTNAWRLYHFSATTTAAAELTERQKKELEEMREWCDELLLPLEWLERLWMRVFTLFLTANGQEKEAKEVEESFERLVAEAKEERKPRK
jgi:hypothetical protein